MEERSKAALSKRPSLNCTCVYLCLSVCISVDEERKGGLFVTPVELFPTKQSVKAPIDPSQSQPHTVSVCLPVSYLLLCLWFACLHAHTEKTRVGNRHQNGQRKRETEASRRASTLLHRSNLLLIQATSLSSLFQPASIT